MKTLRKEQIIEDEMFQNVRTEKEILQMADHPFLLGLDYVFQTEKNIFFVMRFVRGGELYRHLV